MHSRSILFTAPSELDPGTSRRSCSESERGQCRVSAVSGDRKQRRRRFPHSLSEHVRSPKGKRHWLIILFRGKACSHRRSVCDIAFESLSPRKRMDAVHASFYKLLRARLHVKIQKEEPHRNQTEVKKGVDVLLLHRSVRVAVRGCIRCRKGQCSRGSSSVMTHV